MKIQRILLAVALGLAAQVTSAQAPAAQADAAKAAQVKGAIERLHQGNARISEFARLAVEKGTSPQVKQLGDRVLREHAAMEHELTQLAQQRGVALSDARAAVNDPAMQKELARLRALQGAQFDGEIAKWFEQNRAAEVDSYKHVRAQVPDSDPKLKEWVDQAENKMEEQRNFARDVSKGVDQTQRQGRRPAGQ